MKKISITTILLFCLAIAACNNNSEVSDPCIPDSTLRNYFYDSVAYQGWGATNFIKKLSNSCLCKHLDTVPPFYALLYIFEEEMINPKNIDANKELYRFTIWPCFRKPYCIKIERKNRRSYYTVKLTDGNGGYFSGTLTHAITKTYSDTLINTVSKQFSSIDFWSLKEDSTCHAGFDGETWLVEAVKNGKYNVIKRWLPTHCGDSTTKKIGKIGLNLRALGSTCIENIEMKHTESDFKKIIENNFKVD